MGESIGLANSSGNSRSFPGYDSRSRPDIPSKVDAPAKDHYRPSAKFANQQYRKTHYAPENPMRVDNYDVWVDVDTIHFCEPLELSADVFSGGEGKEFSRLAIPSKSILSHRHTISNEGLPKIAITYRAENNSINTLVDDPKMGSILNMTPFKNKSIAHDVVSQATKPIGNGIISNNSGSAKPSLTKPNIVSTSKSICTNTKDNDENTGSQKPHSITSSVCPCCEQLYDMDNSSKQNERTVTCKNCGYEFSTS